MNDLKSLDNVIWSALNSRHRNLAKLAGMAARYAPEVSPFAAMSDGSAPAFNDLRQLVEDGETVALFTAGPLTIPQGWDARQRMIDQMVWETSSIAAEDICEPLGVEDVAEMLELVALTKPGPFAANTIAMGRYLGIRSPEGRLVAMAGQRFHLDGFIEVSAVCTHPNFQQRGLARSVITAVAAEIVKDGCVPFLHVKTENGARFVYEKIGFRLRSQLHLTVLTKTA